MVVRIQKVMRGKLGRMRVTRIREERITLLSVACVM